MNNMLEKVIATLAKQLRMDASKISAESSIKDDLGADSLDILQLLMTIEDEFNVTIPEEALVDFKTVGDVANYLETLNK